MDQGAAERTGPELSPIVHPVSPEGMAGLAVVRQMLEARGSDLDRSFADRRAAMQAFADGRPIPDGVAITEQQLGAVRAKSFAPRAGEGGHCLFIHGGAFVLGSPETHAGLAAQFALATGMTVHSIDYRLAPEYPFPAAPDDCHSAARALHEQVGHFAIIGDSAGGGLAVTTACRLRDENKGASALLLLAPWVDHRLTASSFEQHRSVDLVLSPEGLERDSLAYRGKVSADDSSLSPLLADLRGLAPTQIQVGEREMLHGDAQGLAQAMTSAGVSVELHVFAEMIHGFYAFGLPESAAAVKVGANWLRRDALKRHAALGHDPSRSLP